MKSGYSINTVRDNIVQLSREGVPRKNALAAAYASARVCYFKRYPGGWLPRFLQNPKGYGNKYNYTQRGEPLRKPGSSEIAMIPIQENPSIRAAVRLQKRFSGSVGHTEKINLPALPRSAVAVGPLAVIGYLSNRDGRTALYVHRFAVDSRPHLAVSHDGKQLLILGGGYNFTERGIVDIRRKR